MKSHGYKIKITMAPLPRNCTECPFYYDEWEDCMTGTTDCVLLPYQMNIRGCALERSVDCPLQGTDETYEPPTEKQIEYADQIARKEGIHPLRLAYTKQAYWEFIKKYKEQRNGN